jgi:hypothetical protein
MYFAMGIALHIFDFLGRKSANTQFLTPLWYSIVPSFRIFRCFYFRIYFLGFLQYLLCCSQRSRQVFNNIFARLSYVQLDISGIWLQNFSCKASGRCLYHLGKISMWVISRTLCMLHPYVYIQMFVCHYNIWWRFLASIRNIWLLIAFSRQLASGCFQNIFIKTPHCLLTLFAVGLFHNLLRLVCLLICVSHAHIAFLALYGYVRNTFRKLCLKIVCCFNVHIYPPTVDVGASMHLVNKTVFGSTTRVNLLGITFACLSDYPLPYLLPYRADDK